MNGKEVPWFRHDFNARNDERMQALNFEYGMAGIGRYWCLVEILREQSDYRIPVNKWTYSMLAKTWSSPKHHYTPKDAAAFVDALVDTFHLLTRSPTHLWSASLLRRMETWEDIRAKRKSAGQAGAAEKWGRELEEKNRLTRTARLSEARKKGTHTDEEWQEMLEFFRCCVRCGSDENLRKDHIQPIYQGGSDHISNIQPLCRTCNSSKGPDSTDFRQAFCQTRNLKMPGKWLALPEITSGKMPGKNCQMPGEGVELTGLEESRGELTQNPSLSAPPPSQEENPVIVELMEIHKKAAGIPLLISEDDMPKLLSLFRQYDGTTVVEAYRIHQKEKPGKELRWFLADFAEYHAKAEKQKANHYQPDPLHTERTPEEELHAELEAAKFRQSKREKLTDRDKEVLGITEPATEEQGIEDVF